MFSVYCPHHAVTVLLGPDNIAGVVNAAETIELRWICWCGERGVTTFDRPATPRVAGFSGAFEREGAAS